MAAFTTYSLIQVLLIGTSFGQEWGYEEGIDGVLGPSEWQKGYPMCGEDLQSPIDIDSHIPALSLEQIYSKFDYGGWKRHFRKAKLTNNGLFVVLKSDDMDLVKFTTFYGKYTLQEIHYHWGQNNSVGSENTIDGQRFSLAMHMITYKTELGSYEKAEKEEGGLMVFTKLFNGGLTKDLKAFQDVTNNLGSIKKAESSKTISKFVHDLKEILVPGEDSYFAFPGRLTYPPCTKALWAVFKSKRYMSNSQMEKFRDLNGKYGGKITHNYRYPTFPLDGRQVFYHEDEQY